MVRMALTPAMLFAPMTVEVSPEIQAGFVQLLIVAEMEGRDDEMVVSLLQESTNLMKKRRPRGSSLSTDRAAYLVESGTYTADELDAAEEAIADGALREMELKTQLATVSSSLSAAEVAELLQIDASSVRHRRAKKLLYSFLIGTKRRYPSWQFVTNEDRTLPHLSVLVKSFPEDMHPATVQGFMINPKDSLYVDAGQGTPSDETATAAPRMSPVQWLAEGGSVQAVLDILETYLSA